MRSINLIVVHCSATRADHALTTENLESEHRRRGFMASVITTTSAGMAPSSPPAPWNR